MLQDLYSKQRRPLSQTDLNKVMAQHEHFATKQGGMRAMLASTKLDGLMLANRNLAEADLAGASLVGANLYGTNLSRASLYCADLRDCDLRNATLDKADLRGASFKGANLAFATLNYADLRAATMMYVGEKFRFKGNAHEEAPFGSVDFSNCSLRHASFGSAKLENANFSDALLHGAMFRGAKLDNACFKGAILIGVNLAELNVPPEALKDSITSPTQTAKDRAVALLSALKAHHEWVVSGGKTGSVANVDGEDLRPLSSVLKGLSLIGLSARNVAAVSIDFSDCQLQAAKFEGADLRGASFCNADLSGTNFDRAKLAHADFRGARIQDLILRNGTILPARAEKAIAVASQFSGAVLRTETFTSGVCA